MLGAGGGPLTVVDGDRVAGLVTMELVGRVLIDAHPGPTRRAEP
jgi:hypothetical protein